MNLKTPIMGLTVGAMIFIVVLLCAATPAKAETRPTLYWGVPEGVRLDSFNGSFPIGGVITEGGWMAFSAPIPTEQFWHFSAKTG